MHGSYTHVGIDTAQDGSITIYGDIEREEHTDDIRPIREFEVQIRESTLLV